MKFFLKTFFITFALIQAVQAGRYYNTENGRFISRDPLGYVDGMSLYNAYFAESFGLDPSGYSAESSEECCGGKKKPQESGNWKCCSGIAEGAGTTTSSLSNEWYDADKYCCIEKMNTYPLYDDGSGEVRESNRILVPKDKTIEVSVCFRASQMLPWRWPEKLAAKLGGYHMWLKTEYSERGLGPVNGGVPGEDGNISPYPFTELTDHTGQSEAKGSICFTIKLNACKIGYEMRPRETGKRCGFNYNCNTWVWDSLTNAGASESEITKIKKQAQHFDENPKNGASSIGKAFGSGLSFGGF